MDVEANERSQGRAEVEAQRRRRRGDEALTAAKRLPIPPEIQTRLDAEGLVPRWVNDEGNRIYRLTQQDDYDKVEGVAPVPVGQAEDGSPIMAHLLAKRRDYIEEDQAAAEKRRRETEEALFRKADDSTRGTNPTPATAERYIAPETSFRRGGANQIAEG